MLVLWRSLNISHNRTEQYKKGAEWKWRRLAAEEERAMTSRTFSSYERTLNMLLSFKYLGRVLLSADDDWPAVIRNLTKVREVWQGTLSIMIRERERPRVSGFF